ncbi:MAG TPA: hypothetical protein VMI56_17800 [Reyranella sp.]|nr:hypothetical protein [Reyranella sp.]
MAANTIDLPQVMAKIRTAFEKRNKLYRTTKWSYGGRLEELNARMSKLIADTHLKLPVSQQISLEAQWVINYSDDWQRADDTLKRLAASLDKAASSNASETLDQQDDGSWGPGATEFYRKLEPTVDFLQNEDFTGKSPKPLTFMKWLMKPDEVRTKLEALRVTRIHLDGRNNRDEFGSMITSLTQLFFKKAMRDFFTQHPTTEFSVSDDSVMSLQKYLWKIQGSTGYWGPTYDFEDEVIDVQDLSYTFHIVKYYNDGEKKKLPKIDDIVATTTEVDSYSYPNGLKPPPPDYSDHNNYDLVTMFAQMWDFMDQTARNTAIAEIKNLIEWCLTTSLVGDMFAPSKDMSIVNSFNWGVQFLQVSGYWPPQKPFWADDRSSLPSTPNPHELAARLLARFMRPDINDHSPVANKVIKTLQAAIAAPIA